MPCAAGHQSDVDVVQWHPNSHYLATGSSDRSIRLWDVRDSSTARVFVGHRSPVSPQAAPLHQTHCLGDVQHTLCGRPTGGDQQHVLCIAGLMDAWVAALHEQAKKDSRLS